MLKLCWHFDFHSHRDVNIGRDPDTDGAAAALAGAGVEEIITFAKGHCGYTYYPTDVPTCYRHPNMVGDPFGDVVRSVRQAGLHVLAYVSFGIDGEGARHHPHWRQVGRDGPVDSPDWFIPVCPFTSYTDECVLPQVAEIIDRYEVNGLFFDTMGALGICYCDCCRRAFVEAHGREIPRETSDDGHGIYGRFRHDRGFALLDRLSDFIQKRLPGAAVGFNQVGTPPYPERMPSGCTRLTLDFRTNGHQSRHASRSAAFGSTAPVTADVMTTIFNGGWGDWTPCPPERLEQVAVSIWARRCTGYFGDRMHPDNRLAAPTPEALKTLEALKARLTPHFPPDDAPLAADMLFLHGPGTQYGHDLRHFALNTWPRLRNLSGAADLLLDSGQNTICTAEYCLADAIGPVMKLAVLPELESINPETDEQLRGFAKAGGRVLIVGRLPLVGDRPLSWAGVSQQSHPWQDHLYLPPLDPSRAPEPVLVRGDAFAVTTDPPDPANSRQVAEVIQPAIAPLDMRHGVRFGWGISPPGDSAGGFAAVTRLSVGDRGGSVWVLAAPIFSSYAEMGNWQQVRYLSDLLGRVLPRPFVRLKSPHGQVEAVTYADGTTAWVILINHGGETLSGDGRWPRTWGPLPSHRIELLVRDPEGRRPRDVSANGDRADFFWSEDDTSVTVPVKMDAIWKIVRVDW